MSEKLSRFRMPGEWEPQKSVWIAWPYNKNDWPGLYKFIPEVILEIIYKISKHQKVNLIINSCLLYTSPSPRDLSTSRMPSSA